MRPIQCPPLAHRVTLPELAGAPLPGDADEDTMSILGAGFSAIKQQSLSLPKLPEHIKRVSKQPFAKTPAFSGTVTHDVSLDSPLLNRTPQPGPGPFKQFVFDVMGGIMQHGLRKNYESVEIHGLGRLRNERQEIDFAGCMVFLPTHTDNPRDALLLPGLYPFFPRISNGRGGSHKAMPHFVMKPSENCFEWFGTDVLFRGNILHQKGKPRGPKGNDPVAEERRKAENLRQLTTGAARVKRQGFMSIFNEGRVNGPGIVQQSGGVGAVKAFIDNDGGKVPFIPVHLAFANLGRVPQTCNNRMDSQGCATLTMHRPLKAMLNIGRPFIIDAPPEGDQTAYDAKLRDELQKRQAIPGILTLDSIVGELALRAKSRGTPLQLDANSMEDYVDTITQRVREGQFNDRNTWLNEVAVDGDLYDRKKRRSMCRIAETQLRDNGWIDAAGTLDSERLGDRYDLNLPPQPQKLHLSNPLTYWGRRLDQQATLVPELGSILQEHSGLAASADS